MTAFRAINPGTAHPISLLDCYKALHALLGGWIFDETIDYIADQLPNITATPSEAGYAAGIVNYKQPSANSTLELQAGMSALLLRLPPPVDAK